MSGNEDRYSLGLFSFSSGFLQVPEELVDDEHPLKYKPFDHIGLLRFFKEDGNKSKCPIKAYCGVWNYLLSKETLCNVLHNKLTAWFIGVLY